MSGVNCARRNSSPSARATAFATSVFATPGTPSSRTWPPTSSAAEDPLDRPLLADGDLGHLGHDPVAQALHQR